MKVGTGARFVEDVLVYTGYCWSAAVRRQCDLEPMVLELWTQMLAQVAQSGEHGQGVSHWKNAW